MSHSYASSPVSSGAQSIKWNAVALAGRQAIVILFSLILARILGPSSYGVVAQATVYITFTTMLLDQGISAALLSRGSVDRQLLGASSTLNIGLAIVLAAITWPLALPVASMLKTPELVLVLPVLAAGLLFKGVQLVPRLLLVRQFNFKPLAYIEISTAAIGGIAGVVSAILGADYWAIVVQLLVTDLLLAVGLVATARPPRPNFKLRRVVTLLGFSIKVFVGNVLSFGSRNMDTLLLARFAGETAVGHYSLAYRVLLMPVQLVGQSVTRVLFPMISKHRDSPAYVSRLLLKASQSIAAVTFPMMALIAVASHDAVMMFLGNAWAPAVPIIIVLAFTGARQSITVLNSPTMLGFGRPGMQLWFTALAAVMQVGGMIVGLAWSALGVAVGYTIGGILMMPVIFAIQRHLAGSSFASQIKALGAPLNAALWASATYGVLYLFDLPMIVRLCLGFVLFAGAYFAVLRLVHRRTFTKILTNAREIMIARKS